MITVIHIIDGRIYVRRDMERAMVECTLAELQKLMAEVIP